MTALPQITCDNCGGCCCLSMMAPPWADDDSDWNRVPKEIQEWSIEQEAGGFKVGSPCYWLDTETRRCKHYEHRPDCCRNFEVGGELCLEDRATHGII